ncbi:MAG: thiamine pyrophosphate-dependent enzyme, partial [Gemmatimonadetes bacterium]|nr:thiamine pyrophosphate-dependent enzyme [Candidatus Palauibacter australiensis]
LNLLYIIENNGVYGLTKGQFSASADMGSKSKRGVPNEQPPIDPVLLGLSIGATFVARGFSGDKNQLVPIIKAGIRHPGLALVDVISPCVTFNDHVGSTKSYAYTREHFREAVEAAFVAPKDFVPPADEITADIGSADVRDVRMHDGSVIRFRQVEGDYDATDRDAVYGYLRERQNAGEVPTGLLYVDPESRDLHDVLETVERPLWNLPFEELCPGAEALDALMENYR